MVDNVAGTTVDPVDTWWRSTARTGSWSTPPASASASKYASGTEYYAALRTRPPSRPPRWPSSCSTVSEPISEQDQRVLTMVMESGRALVLAFNKWDLVDEDRRYYLEKEIERELAQVTWAPRVNISALTGRVGGQARPRAAEALEGWEPAHPDRRAQPVDHALARPTPPPGAGGKRPKVLFATQAGADRRGSSSSPPAFLEAGYRAVHRAPPARGLRLQGHARSRRCQARESRKKDKRK